jgi:peptide-methionine (S)-S-oxide reductase
MVLRSEILVNKNVLPTKEQALPGRETPMNLPEKHFVHDAPLLGPFAMDVDFAIFGLGCFWGAERKFWQREGVVSTVVGYAGGFTPNPTYEEVCSGLTGHSEVVLVVYEPAKVSYEELLKMFWELHNPTQGMRQGNDIGDLRHQPDSTGSRQTQRASVPGRVDQGWQRHHHHRNRRSADGLLCRGLSPAVPGEKP